MLSKLKLNQLYFKDTSFVNLMTKRIFNVLLVANPYDAFMLEDDGRIDEKIFNEYMNLSLRYPPRFTQVSTEEAAWKQLENTTFDLVICMPGSDNSDTFEIARSIKEQYPHIPLVVLTPFSHGITARMEHEDLSIFEYVFCWLGNTDLLVSIIKLIEDKMNLEHDIKEVGVQMILLVEDSIRFYSSVLPNLYKFVLKQSQEFATEALNAHQRTLRMRGRPKIVLARTYEEAMDLYNKYQNNVLGVITDVEGVDALEINISCPNVKEGGLVFGTCPDSAAEVVKAVKSNTSKMVITKLSPNVTDIVAMAQAVEAAGTDAISLINTLIGMKIDIDRQKPVLGNVIGGLSGPAVRPVAVRMCYQVAQNVHVPIIGMGGIMTAEDAIEFFLAGASAVAVGTVNFTNPCIAETISHGILEYMDKHGIKKLKDMIGLALPEGKIHLKRAVKR